MFLPATVICSPITSTALGPKLSLLEVCRFVGIFYPPSGILNKLRRVAVVKTDDLEERIASIIRVTKIGELGTTLAEASNRSTMRRNSA
jgi:hypothetical protein